MKGFLILSALLILVACAKGQVKTQTIEPVCSSAGDTHQWKEAFCTDGVSEKNLAKFENCLKTAIPEKILARPACDQNKYLHVQICTKQKSSSFKDCMAMTPATVKPNP